MKDFEKFNSHRFAKATGIHATNISKIENGKYGFTIDALNQLLSMYGSEINFVE